MSGLEPAVPASAEEGLAGFAALAAHQLGEAIALMRGAAAVLEGEQAALGAGGQDALRALGAGGERAQRYVDDLLDVVRAGSEPTPGASTNLDVALDAALDRLGTELARGPVHVQREPLPRVPLDADAACVLLVHLLRSALSAGATRLGVDGRAEGDGAVVEVYDNGTPAADGDAVFLPFAPPRGRGGLVGAGVSLPLARMLAQRAGGRVSSEVRPDGATIVTVVLPNS